MATPNSREPAHLGRHAAVDPLSLEPGLIVWDRFCVVGKVHHAGPRWSVTVTDLARELGRAPHHRVTLTQLPVPANEHDRVLRAVAADQQVQPRVRAVLELHPGNPAEWSRGLVLAHDPVEGERLGAQLPAREARALTLALAGMLARLHEAQVWGLQLRLGDLRQSEGQFRVDGLHHLLGTGVDAGEGSAAEDLAGVLALLRRLAGDHVAAVLEPPPRSADELWSRARALTDESGPVATLLSPQPPFVGREAAIEALEQAFAEARIARASISLICGGQGLGKSRLLDELAARLRLETDALVLRGEYLRGCGESRAGLMGALEALPRRLGELELRDRARIRDRLARRVGSRSAALARYAPGLTELLQAEGWGLELVTASGPAQAPAARRADGFELEEGFASHAGLIADAVRCVGSQSRPLVLLLDNLQLADRGSLAVLRRLLLEDRNHHTMIVAGLCGPAPAGLAELPDEHPWGSRGDPAQTWQRDPQLLLRQITLEPLTTDELERLIVAGLPGPIERPRAVAEALVEVTCGNPLLAWATLQSWIERGVMARDGVAPWTLRSAKVAGTHVRQVFGARVEQASLDERWLAVLAAVAGGHVDEPWLQRLSGWELGRVAAAVEALERRGLMSRVGEASLRFPHELVRELILEATEPGELRRAHATIARWLESLGPRVSAARLAYHTDCALRHDGRGDALLAEMHLAAGREMLGVFDLERSGWHFTRALSEHGGGVERCAAIEGAADVALLGDNHDQAAQLYAEAVAEAEDPLRACRIAAKAVHALFRKSAASEAAQIGRLALARADRPLPTAEHGLRLRAAELQARLRLRFTASGSGAGRLDEALREQLCWLYARMFVVLAVPEPRVAELCLSRALVHARGLDSAAAASVHAMHGALLATRGRVDAGRSALGLAVELAAKVGSDWALAHAQHLRGHLVEHPCGEYAAGQASLDQAIANFRRTGDLSIAVSSLLFKAIYGRDREPLSKLHEWLDEAAAINEVQGDTVVDLAIEALRLLLRARIRARGVAEAAANLAARVAGRRVVGFEDFLPHAYLAMALLELGDTSAARAQIERAHASVPSSPGGQNPEFAHDLTAATALVLAQRNGTLDERRRFADALARLDDAGRGSARLAALAQLARMRDAVHQGQPERARAAAESLIAGLGTHGQIHLALQAHQCLAELLRGPEVLAAREHLRLAGELGQRLGLGQARERERERERSLDELDVPRPRGRERSSRRHSNAYLRAVARNELVDVPALLERSRQVLLDTVGGVSWIYLRADPQLRVYGEQVDVQSMLVHLALCARDAVVMPEQLRAVGTVEELDAHRAAAIPGASPGRWGKITVTVVGARTQLGVSGGVSACRQFATRLGGFLEVDQEDELLTLAVYLPPERDLGRPRARAEPEPSARHVYVLHPDPLICETLAGAVTRLGHECDAAAPEAVDLRELPTVDVLFVDGETLADYANLLPPVATTVEIVSRGLRRASDYPPLRVPFALGELRKYLDREA